MNTSFDIYEIVTNLIIERLEADVVSWQMPRKAETGFPLNMVHKTAYRGFNFWYLLTVSDKFGSPFFLTFNQVKELRGHVLKGEKGFPVVFWKSLDKEEKEGSILRVINAKPLKNRCKRWAGGSLIFKLLAYSLSSFDF